MQHRIFIVGLALACLAFFNCSNDFTSSSVDSGPGAEQGVQSDSTMKPGECTSAIHCGGGELCDPTTHRCVQSLSCSGHGDCGQAAYCDGSACRVSKTGSPCAGNESCIPGEVCVGGFCGCEGQSYGADNVGPNMLIVLDRSGSMDFEIEGGTDDPNRPHDYYLAEDAATLSAALDAIAGQVLSCAYTLSEDPADLDKLYVYQQAQPIARDTAHLNGWDYDTAVKQLTFYGPACDALRSGAVTDLVIVYGCPIVIK